ncbi:AtpZ/AtpI family protein [Egicoccus sp. AB-alg6-2]|uniref:AtpZ/AtpI family protein n=1 Tax=Egicoccus sp. AB-alg6-2 TaxID=3242692 RepID=UPI00359D3304
MALPDSDAADARPDARAAVRRDPTVATQGVLSDSFRRSLRGLDHANVMSVELISAILLWAGLGWLVDRWLGTPPWFLVIGGLIGNFAGLYLVYLRGERMNAEEERTRALAAGRGPAMPTGGAE